MSKLQITLGSDPELMLWDCKQNKIVSATKIVKQDKHNPIILWGDTKMYYDNALVETSMPAAYTPKTALFTMREALGLCHRKLGPRYALAPIASHNFDDLPPKPSDDRVRAWLANPEDKGEDIPEEWRIGCNPNYDAYKGEAGETRKQEPFTDNLRTGSFHVHIGNSNFRNKDEFTLLTAKDKVRAVKLMDVFVGLSETIFNHDMSGLARKKLYGKAGEFRPTEYGIEYRVLSNYALRSPALVSLVYDLTEFAMSYMDDIDKAEGCINMMPMDKVQEAINTSNKALALDLLQNSELPGPLWSRVVTRDNKFAASSTTKQWGI